MQRGYFSRHILVCLKASHYNAVSMEVNAESVSNTQEDFVAAQPHDESVHGIHQVSEINMIVENVPGMETAPSPYPPRELSKLAEREVILEEFTVGSGEFYKVYNISDIITKAQVKRAFQVEDMFNFKRVVFRVAVVATPFLYGRICLAGKPIGLRGGNLGTGFDPRLATCDHHLISVAQTEALECSFPWISYSDWLETSTPACDYYPMEWTLTDFHPILSVNDPDATVHVIVYARLEGVNFGLPRRESSVPKMGIKKRKKKASNKEGEAKSEEFSVSGTMEQVSTLANTFSSFPVIGEWAGGIGMVADMLGHVAHEFGLIKPVTTQPVQNMLSWHEPQDWMNTRSLSTIPRVSLGPDAVMSQDHTIFGDETDFTCIGNFVRTPALYMHKISITESDPVGNRFFDTVVDPDKLYYNSSGIYAGSRVPTYLSYMCNIHQYWRGSIAFTVVISAPKTSTFKLGVSLEHKTLNVPSGAGPSMVGQLLVSEIQVLGDTEFTLEVPYLWNRRYGFHDTYYNDSVPKPWLTLWLMSPLQSSGFPGETVVYGSVYVSAGSDFTVWNPSYTYGDLSEPIPYQHPNLVPVPPTPPAKIESKKKVLKADLQWNPRRDRIFSTLPGAKNVVASDVNFGEATYTWKDLVLRMQTDEVAESSVSWYPSAPPGKPTSAYFAIWMFPFTLYRTGARYYVSDALTSDAKTVGGPLSVNESVSITGGPSQITRIVGRRPAMTSYASFTTQFEIPFNCSFNCALPYMEEWDSPLAQIKLPATNVPAQTTVCKLTGTVVVWSFSDDFSAGFPCMGFYFPN